MKNRYLHLSGGIVKMDSCMFDFLEQCFHECENCPRKIQPEPDWDHLRDLEREQRYDIG